MFKEIPKYPLFIYLAGYMSGSKLNECLEWRITLRKYYENWKGQLRYEIEWLDPFNDLELHTIDKKGLTSSIPSNAIFEGDLLSIRKTDLIIANINTFGETREMVGTFYELGYAKAKEKPYVIIADESKWELANKHPFLNKACGIYKSVDELIESKLLNFFFKRINPANYDWKV